MKTWELILLIAIIAMFSQDVRAGDDSCGDISCPGNPFDCCPNGGNCTWYGYYKRSDLYPACNGYANEWWAEAISANKPTGSSPAAGAIACFDNMQPNGPIGELGMPITNQYSQGGNTLRQDFQKEDLTLQTKLIRLVVRINIVI
jgi:hypothetical protein